MADFSILDRADQETDAPDWVIRVGIAIVPEGSTQKHSPEAPP